MSTAVEKYFFTPLYHPRSAWSVVGWWESRRPLFNAVVGGAGLVSLGTVSLLEGPPPLGLLAGGVLVYGVMANLCYTLGPAADLALRRFLGEHAAAAGPVLFRYGFVFSIGLTLLPVPLVVLSWLIRLLM